MEPVSITIRDLVWLGTLFVTLALAYARVKSELRHLDDVKAERSEVQSIAGEIRSRLEEIGTSVTRVEEAIRRIFPAPPGEV
ncbi:MAG: hypothetical protein MAG453_00139 [Calditrichaeota bacterium]|nr:hypothetical protein [Calditrichota bacterium]